MTRCTHCGKKIGPSNLVVHVADAFAHEAPSGMFCGSICFLSAVAARDAVNFGGRVVADVVCVRGE